VKRIYVPLPDVEARRALLVHLIEKHHRLSGKPAPPAVAAAAAAAAAGAAGAADSDSGAVSSSLWNVLTGNPKTRKPRKPAKSPSSNVRSMIRVDDNDAGEITEPHLQRIVEITDGYSGSDLTAVGCFGYFARSGRLLICSDHSYAMKPQWVPSER
jgi:SpoVK/Ycf46/Vps4 family AAA+-type ATPase